MPLNVTQCDVMIASHSHTDSCGLCEFGQVMLLLQLFFLLFLLVICVFHEQHVRILIVQPCVEADV